MKKAFNSGDPESVEKMLIMIIMNLNIYPEDHDPTPVDAQKQLEREFGHSLDHVINMMTILKFVKA
ncbi:hypothetical protein EIP86_005861 [Pleurotus ostreatoroseus]|nr:hypothetical protein EIP86_005861 [Pleurotus ostreatoroseus]